MRVEREITRSRGAGALLVVALLASTTAHAALTKTGESTVTFHAVATGGLKVNGTTHDLELSEDGTTVKIAVPLANIDTGIGLRNKHMREKYLEVDKYPKAELTVDRRTLKLPAENAEATGQMTIHGQTKPVAFKYTARPANGGYAVSGSTHLVITDFGIQVPSYLGVTVKPDVDVDAQFSASER